jgi:hypothetical protein
MHNAERNSASVMVACRRSEIWKDSTKGEQTLLHVMLRNWTWKNYESLYKDEVFGFGPVLHRVLYLTFRNSKSESLEIKSIDVF